MTTDHEEALIAGEEQILRLCKTAGLDMNDIRVEIVRGQVFHVHCST
jgi:hypothetical protein